MSAEMSTIRQATNANEPVRQPRAAISGRVAKNTTATINALTLRAEVKKVLLRI